MTLTLDDISNLLTEDRAAIPALYTPESPAPEEDRSDWASEARDDVAEAEAAVSTLREYLRRRASHSHDLPEASP